MVGEVGLGPTTTTLSEWPSNQLKYSPILVKVDGTAPPPHGPKPRIQLLYDTLILVGVLGNAPSGLTAWVLQTHPPL